MAGERMEKVLDSVVEYAREAMDDMGESMLEMVEVIEKQEDEIDELRGELELQERIKDSWKTAFKEAIDAGEELKQEIVDMKEEMEEMDEAHTMLSVAYVSLCEELGVNPYNYLYEAQKASQPREEEIDIKEVEEKPACCAAGHCGTDKCGCGGKEEAKLGVKFTLGQYEQKEAKAKGESIFVVIKPDGIRF